MENVSKELIGIIAIFVAVVGVCVPVFIYRSNKSDEKFDKLNDKIDNLSKELISFRLEVKEDKIDTNNRLSKIEGKTDLIEYRVGMLEYKLGLPYSNGHPTIFEKSEKPEHSKYPE
jgi:glucose uptake protein GlcU